MWAGRRGWQLPRHSKDPSAPRPGGSPTSPLQGWAGHLAALRFAGLAGQRRCGEWKGLLQRPCMRGGTEHLTWTSVIHRSCCLGWQVSFQVCPWPQPVAPLLSVTLMGIRSAWAACQCLAQGQGERVTEDCPGEGSYWPFQQESDPSYRPWPSQAPCQVPTLPSCLLLAGALWGWWHCRHPAWLCHQVAVEPGQ